MGIHTGPVLQGNIGDEHRSAFTFMGDTVNVASRLESLCKDSGSPLFVSADLAAKATLPVGRFAGPLDERLKGRSDSLLLYYLTKETSAI